MGTKVLLALAATLLIAAGALVLTWAFAQTWRDFGHVLRLLRRHARHPWAQEDQALAQLQEQVRALDPALTEEPPSPQGKTPPSSP